MVDGKCGGEFRKFGALSVDGVVPWSFRKCTSISASVRNCFF